MTAKTIKDYADEWEKLPWNLFQKELFRLQHRIYEASKKGDQSSTKKLQTLLLASKCAKYLAVKYLVQLSLKRKNFDVHFINSFTAEHHFLLVENLKNIKLSKKIKVNNTSIFGTLDKKTYAIITSLQNRCLQCLLKYALEPVYQACIYENYHKAQSKYSPLDIQKKILHECRSNISKDIKHIVTLNLMDCFTKVVHDKLMRVIILPNSAKLCLFSLLKARIVEKNCINLQFMDQDRELILPLLHEILLHRIEDVVNQKIDSKKIINGDRGIRYDKNLMLILESSDSITNIFNRIKYFLEERGLEFKQMEEKIFLFKEGFSFLDWHFFLKNKNNRIVAYPSKSNVKQFTNKVKNTLKSSKYKLIKRLEFVKRIYYNWCLYHQHCDMSYISASLWSIKNWSYKYLKKNSNMAKQERVYYIHMVFSKTKHFLV